MKRAISWIMVLCMILSFAPVAVSAAQSGTCGENVTWSLDGSVLTLSGTGATYDYVDASTPEWYRSREQVRTIVVGEGITYLGTKLFAYTTKATEVRLPQSLKEIGKDAFMACYALKTAELPDGLETIREGAFHACKALSSVELPQTLTVLEPYAFSGCGMSEITIPESITALPEHCFERCEKLETVVFHENVDTIDDFCFSICTGLKTIDLPAGLDEISWGCFSNSGLTSIVIPEGVKLVDSYAFSLCTELEEVTIPDSVLTMEQYCFRGTESLKTVKLPADLKKTGWGMFQQGGLESIVLPYGLETVTEYTFCDCDSLTQVSIPDTVLYMKDYCFRDCGSLTTVTLPANLKYLSWGMFQDSGLETLVIPDSVSHTEDYVFSGCDNLQSITYPDHAFTFGDYAFAYCEGPTTFDLPAKLTQLSWGMFSGSTITGIDIPDTVKEVEDYAFHDCDGLTEVTFPDSVTRMGDYIFRDCDGIETVHLPAHLTRIPWGMFMHCSIRELTIPDGVTEIGNHAFWNARNLEKLVVPASVQTVGTSMVFDGADALVIYCWENSFIHKYAEEKQIPYVLLDGTEEPGPSEPTEPSEPSEPVNPFVDVAETDFFYDAVLWAVEQGITTGTTEITFSPNDSCMRAHVVTFLWRAMGCPAPQSRENPFTDVKETDFFYDAVLWAVEQGITNGMTADTFGSYEICNRAQVVTFLHRALGRPDAQSAENPFTDVHSGDYFYDAVLWAVSNGITSGVDAVTFAPARECVRAQTVTFLYRALAE